MIQRVIHTFGMRLKDEVEKERKKNKTTGLAVRESTVGNGGDYSTVARENKLPNSELCTGHLSFQITRLATRLRRVLLIFISRGTSLQFISSI